MAGEGDFIVLLLTPVLQPHHFFYKEKEREIFKNVKP